MIEYRDQDIAVATSEDPTGQTRQARPGVVAFQEGVITGLGYWMDNKDQTHLTHLPSGRAVCGTPSGVPVRLLLEALLPLTDWRQPGEQLVQNRTFGYQIAATRVRLAMNNADLGKVEVQG